MKFFLLVCCLFLTACSTLGTNRTYLSEMESDDSHYFEAGVDFPVLAGDSGRTWRSKSEWNNRIPASEKTNQYRKVKSSLRTELRELEASLADNSLALYEQHKLKFHSDSERIFFLRLPANERAQYLQSKGITGNIEDKFLTPMERMRVIHQSEITLGMTKRDVEVSWGRPLRVEVAGNPSYENERWIYSYNGATKYVYFESGKVEGWE
jgi:hypothetical protein